jgi:hypothetical protein
MIKPLMNGATSQKVGRDVVRFSTDQKKFKVVIISDGHFDNPHSQLKWLQNKLDNEFKDAYIIIGGDSIDVMQGKKDNRSNKSILTGDTKRDDYFNAVYEYVKKEIHDRYLDRIITWNRGNHDNSIINHNEIDLISLICGEITPVGAVSGYVNFSYNAGGGSNAKSASLLLYYQHIPDSGGKRSKGMLTVDTIRGKYPDADLFLTEHIHNAWIHPEAVERVDRFGNVNQKIQWFIQNTTIKDEFNTERNGFYHEKIKAGAQIVGFSVIEFEFIREIKEKEKIKLKATPAIVTLL